VRLTVVLPGGEEHVELVREECAAWVAPGTELDVVAAPVPGCVASRHQIALAAPALLDEVGKAAASGSDGVFIACAGDPAVHAAREVADVPVVGGFQPALLTALSLGHRVGVISVLPGVVPIVRELIRHDGLGERCRSVRTIDVEELSVQDRAGLLDRLHEQAAAAVAGGEADVVVLGCTGFVGVAAALQERLAAGGAYVPVIDPTGAALLWLESVVRLGVRPSRTTYAPPPVMRWLP
jgi:allantoin racemase